MGDGGCSASTQQPWSASSQRVQEQPPQSRPLDPGLAPAGGSAMRPQYPAGASGAAVAPAGLSPQPQDESFMQVVYSTLAHENVVTLGPTMLQGVGTVDGVASVAKVLLQRIPCSVCYMHGHPADAHMGGGGHPHASMMGMGAPA